MPRRDINELMHTDPKPDRTDAKHVDRMRNLLEPGKDAAKPPPRKALAAAKKTLTGSTAYEALKVDKAALAIISETARLLGGNIGDKPGKPPAIIGGLTGEKGHNFRLGPVEHHALYLRRVALATGKWPDDCPDPLQLARAVIQQWYAEWGPELEAATGIQPKHGKT